MGGKNYNNDDYSKDSKDYFYGSDGDEEHGFEDYEQTTVNPGKWLYVGIVALCLLILLIPVALLHLKRRRKRKASKKRLENASKQQDGIFEAEMGADDSSETLRLSTFETILRGRSFLRAQRMEEWNNLARPIFLAATRSRIELERVRTRDSVSVPSVSVPNTSRGRGIPTKRQSDEGSTGSEKLRLPTFEAIFRGRAYREAQRKKEKEISDLMILATGEHKPKKSSKWWKINRKKKISGEQMDLSKELIESDDAIDDFIQIESGRPSSPEDNSTKDAPHSSSSKPFDVEEDSKQALDASTKVRPPSAKETFEYVMALPKRDAEMKKILKLAIPYSIASLIESLFDLLTMAVIGNLLGTAELEAYIVVYFALGLGTMFLEGLLTSLTTVCSQAVGAGKYKLAGQYTQIAVFLYELLFVPQVVVWYLYFGDLMLWFGFDQEVASIGQGYINVYVFIYVFEAVHHAFHFLLEVSGYEKFMVIAEGIHELVCFTVILAVAWYLEPSLQLIGIIQLVVHIIMIACEFIYVFGFTSWMEHYASGLVGSFAFSNARAVKVFLQTAIPQSIGYVLSYGEWQIMFLLASALGPAEVAAWGIIGEIWDMLESLTLAWGDAAEVRCAHLLAAGNPDRASLSAHKSLFLGTLSAVISSGVLLGLMNFLPLLLTQDTTLQRMVREAIPFVAIANVALALGTISWQLVGSQARYGVATVVQCIGSWFVAIPLAVVSSYVLHWDLRGMVAAVVVGCTVSGALNLAIILMTKWEKASARVMRKTTKGLEDEEDDFSITDPVLPDYSEAAAGLFVDGDVPEEVSVASDEAIKGEYSPGEVDRKRSGSFGITKDDPSSEEEILVDPYDDLDWDELPDHVRKAAIVCGFNERIWNANGITKYDEYDWDELPSKVQNAAQVLGYDEHKWDDE